MNFFEVYKALEHSKTSIQKIVNREEALSAIVASMDAYDSIFHIKKKKRVDPATLTVKPDKNKSLSKKKKPSAKAVVSEKPNIIE